MLTLFDLVSSNDMHKILRCASSIWSKFSKSNWFCWKWKSIIKSTGTKIAIRKCYPFQLTLCCDWLISHKLAQVYLANSSTSFPRGCSCGALYCWKHLLSLCFFIWREMTSVKYMENKLNFKLNWLKTRSF